jgi:hypothetical protein
MDGAANTNTIEARLVALDITDAAYRLWAELYDAWICSGDEYGNGPSLARAWELYVERGAHNYAWWDDEGAFNADGWTAFNRFADAFEDGPGIYGHMHA